MSLDALVALSSLAMAALLAGLGVFTDPAPIYVLMAIAGVGQMGVMSSFNLAAQNALPSWVRGRGLAVYTLVFQLAIAVGALVVGCPRDRRRRDGRAADGGRPSCSGRTCSRSASRWRGASGSDMTPVQFPEPQIADAPDFDDGPAWCGRVADRSGRPGRVRGRDDGAEARRRRDGAVATASGTTSTIRAGRRELRVQSWGEHLRQRERATESDRAAWQHARAFHRGEDGVLVRWHLMLHPDRTGSATVAFRNRLRRLDGFTQTVYRL